MCLACVDDAVQDVGFCVHHVTGAYVGGDSGHHDFASAFRDDDEFLFWVAVWWVWSGAGFQCD